MAVKKITIGLNGSMLDERPTGVGVYSFNIINSLSQLYENQKSHNLTVFSPTDFWLNKNLRIVKLSNLLQSSKYGKIAAFCRFLWNTFYYPLVARQFDILVSPTTHGSFLSNKQIITIHDLLSLRYNNISFHQRLYFKYLLPYLISKARLIIAVSETTKKEIVQYLKCPEDKIKVIYNGYDHIRYFEGTKKTAHIYSEYFVRNYFLAIGPTYPHKNFETLIDAYGKLSPTLRKKYPLVIAGGKKKYLNHLKRYVAKLEIRNEVHFLGYVPIQLMPYLYREAYALVFPSLYEGFGIPLLEAMACGCPVISSNTSSMPEVCGDAAIYFDPLDTDSLATAMKFLIGNENTRQELTERGLIQSKKFSWEQSAKNLKTEIDKQFQKTNF